MVRHAARAVSAQGTDPGAKAEVVATVDDTGQNYEWAVTNHHYSPIVAIEFAHYKGHLLFAPQGWSVDCGNLYDIGWKDETGVCRAECDAAADGIIARRTKTFRMHVGDRGVDPGPGDFIVRFADGERYTVAGVPLPVPYRVEGRYVSLIGLGAIFLLFLVYRWLAGRRGLGAAAAAVDEG